MLEKVKTCIVDNRWYIFVVICLVIHVALAKVFIVMETPVATAINIGSLVFYFIVLFRKNHINRNYMTCVNIEVTIFAFSMTMIFGMQSGFFLYTLGMLTGDFMHAFDMKKRGTTLQLFGIGEIILMTLLCLRMREHGFYYLLSQEQQEFLFLFNMCIALFTIMAVYHLYNADLQRLQTVLDEQNERLQYQAAHDLLTGLYNRYQMTEKMRMIQQQGEKNIVVAMFDIDDFKQINDTYGHLCGDEILKEVSAIAKRCMSRFFLARWGGEEFLVIATDFDDGQPYLEIAEFHKEIRNTNFKYEGQEIKVTVTIGLTQGHSTQQMEKLISEVDRYLYEGKKHGKDCLITAEGVFPE